MKFGVREICNTAFKCKSDNTQIGDKTFMKDDLVIYFDSAKTSNLEGTSTAVYAQGGRGNPRLVTWEGEKEMTFTFEDALISPLGLSILMGANLTTTEDYYHHVLVKGRAVNNESTVQIDISDEIVEIGGSSATLSTDTAAAFKLYQTDEAGSEIGTKVTGASVSSNVITAESLVAGNYYLVDGYVKVSGSTLSIEADKFSDYFYIEAETLFRRESDGVDCPAQFVIPKGKVSSNFNISMANTGDPSTFTFEVAAMEDYVKFDKTRKVLCAFNILG